MFELASKQAWLGLGGNVGDVEANMASALQMLDANDDIELLKVSPIYKTPPWGVTDQDWFLNGAAKIATRLQPKQLLEACLAAESALKRQRTIRWGPRSIDVDLLVYEGVEQSTSTLTLPHPRMHERAFVLKPLADIASDLIVYGKSVAEWLNTCDLIGIEDFPTAQDWYLPKGDA